MSNFIPSKILNFLFVGIMLAAFNGFFLRGGLTNDLTDGLVLIGLSALMVITAWISGSGRTST